jgi:predicted Zn-dependent peptidase
LNPLFAPEEIEKERGVVIEELNMYEDMPMRKVQDVFLSLLYGDQPAGWDVGGEKEIIRKLKREDFIAYREKHYVMPGTVMLVAGKFDEKKVVAQVRASFDGLKRHPVVPKPKTREAQSKPRLKLKFKESDQGHLVLGFRAFDVFDERRYAAEILADVLGGGMSSRLFKRVREELGAAYYINADIDLMLDHGAFDVSAGVDHSKIETVIEAILEECRRVIREPVPDDELRRAKDHMTGNLILGLETSDDLANYYGGQEILTKTLLSPEQLIDRIQAVTAADVRSVAKAIFKNKGLNLAIIGPYRNPTMFEGILKL